MRLPQLAWPHLAWAWRWLGAAEPARRQPFPAPADGLAVEPVWGGWGAAGSKRH